MINHDIILEIVNKLSDQDKHILSRTNKSMKNIIRKYEEYWHNFVNNNSSYFLKNIKIISARNMYANKLINHIINFYDSYKNISDNQMDILNVKSLIFIPDTIFNYQELELVNADKNLTLGSLLIMNSLTKLTFHAYISKQLPDDIFKLIQLQYLSINGLGENLKIISSIKNLLNLIEFKINGYDNLIICEEIFMIPEVTITNCRNIIFPDELNIYPNVTYLNLSHNLLSKLPIWFNKLINVNHLDLTDNYFKNIPTIIYQLPKLHYIRGINDY